MAESAVKILNIIGDDPLVEGGGVVWTESGKKRPQYSWWGQPADLHIEPTTCYTVYTVPVPDNVIEAYPHIDIKELAAFTHDTPEELIRLGGARDIDRRVSLLDALQSFVGSSSMDQNPVVMTFGSMVHKWGAELAEPQDDDWEDVEGEDDDGDDLWSEDDDEDDEDDDEYESELWSFEDDEDDD